jgi:hypothetical protein
MFYGFWGIDPPESFLCVFGFALAGPVLLVQSFARSPPTLPILGRTNSTNYRTLGFMRVCDPFFVLTSPFCSAHFLEQASI